jgi:hypothetical protein
VDIFWRESAARDLRLFDHVVVDVARSSWTEIGFCRPERAVAGQVSRASVFCGEDALLLRFPFVLPPPGNAE